MNGKKQMQYRNSKEYKITRILMHFRNGLHLSRESISEKVFISDSMIRFYEMGKTAISRTILQNYSSAIAEIMNFHQDVFYQMLIQEAKQLENDSSLQLLHVVARITFLCSQPAEILQDEKSIKEEEKIENNMVKILACIRRILDIPQKMTPVVNISLSRKEIGKMNASKEFTLQYAQFIAEQMGYPDFENFYRLLEKAASSFDKMSSPIYQKVMVAFARFIRELYEDSLT